MSARLFLHRQVFFKLSWGREGLFHCLPVGVVPGLQTCEQRKLSYLVSFKHCYNFESVHLAFSPIALIHTLTHTSDHVPTCLEHNRDMPTPGGDLVPYTWDTTTHPPPQIRMNEKRLD